MNTEEKIVEDRYLIQRITISKKFSFSLIAMIAVIGVLFIVKGLQFDEKATVITIVSTQISLLVITVAYLTGQAKIDLQASATYGKRALTPSFTPFSIPPPSAPDVGSAGQAVSPQAVSPQAVSPQAVGLADVGKTIVDTILHKNQGG